MAAGADAAPLRRARLCRLVDERLEPRDAAAPGGGRARRVELDDVSDVAVLARVFRGLEGAAAGGSSSSIGGRSSRGLKDRPCETSRNQCMQAEEDRY